MGTRPPSDLNGDTPRVSVVVPVYASERYVADTLRSVLAQSFADFELIVVDDGSPDRSIARCREFTDPRIRYVHQENAGLAAARNAGIRAARGEFVAFVDSDDLWAPDKLARHVSHLESRPDLGFSYSFSALIDETGAPLGSYQMLGQETTTAADIFVRNPIGNGSNAVVRTCVFRGVRSHRDPEERSGELLFDTELRQAEDFELWTRIAVQTDWAIGCIPWALTHYRLHPSGLSADVERQRSYHMRAIEKIASYAPELVDDHRAAAESTLHWYLARNLLLQRQLKAARGEVAKALRSKLSGIQAYHVLLAASLGLAGVLPTRIHAALARAALVLYGRTQQWSMGRQQRAMAAAIAG